MSLLVLEIVNPLAAGFKILKFIAIFIYPLYGYSHLFINLNKFHQIFTNSCRQLYLRSSSQENSEYLKDMNRTNVMCSLMIMCQNILYYLSGRAVINDPFPPSDRFSSVSNDTNTHGTSHQCFPPSIMLNKIDIAYLWR